MRRKLAGLLVVASLASACVDGGSGASEVAGDTEGVGGSILVFAAASLADAFADVGAAFEADRPRADVALNLAGSSSLREQILAGAPADVFASANPSNVDLVVDAGAVVGVPAAFARNELQIVVPADNPGGVTGLGDFADGDLLLGLCAAAVPCGDLARQALASAGVDPSVDTNEPDARALLTKVGAGELDAGIVYVTDVTAAGDSVAGVDIPAEHQVVAEYTIAVLGDGTNTGGGAAFVAFVSSPAGRAILEAHGFSTP